MPLPPVEPTVVLADASPLIHLAIMGPLDLPLRFGPVVIPDAVEIETTHDAAKPYAAELLAWMDANARRGGGDEPDVPAPRHSAGYVADPEAAWAVVAAQNPRANPALNYQVIEGRAR